MNCNAQELVICAIARLLGAAGTVAVGSSSPVPAAAALLAHALRPTQVRALIFRNNIHDPFPESGSELYDRVGQGRIDVFFLGGGQIDGQANLNMVGVGPYPQTPVRFPGNHGTPFIYYMVPRVIIYREEHSRRVLVPRVDYVSAPGISPPHIYRRGGPTDLVTSMAMFAFDRSVGRFTLRSVHPRYSVDDVVQNTGFDFDRPSDVPPTPEPSDEWLALLRGAVRQQVAETYPRFARTHLQDR
ncbi:MAG TPA: CoA-transferase [Casimicrobiaceae bacterium]|nr:CoA-transferase [Casimicrobiaceae bacterium]